jgi:hypothetical protein
MLNNEAIPMVLFCPRCGEQHIDAPTPESLDAFDSGADIEYIRKPAWTNPPHRSHLCQFCRYIWRPADVATVGVAAVQTKGNDDSPLCSVSATAQAWALIRGMQGILANCAVESDVCMCGEDMRTHSDPMSCGHCPVDSGAHHAASLLEDVNKFLGETKNENAT